MAKPNVTMSLLEHFYLKLNKKGGPTNLDKEHANPHLYVPRLK